MIKFLPLYFLGVSHRILLPILALGPEIFKFERCVKYANEKTDDVMHSSMACALRAWAINR